MPDIKLNTEGVDLSVFETQPEPVLNIGDVDLSIFGEQPKKKEQFVFGDSTSGGSRSLSSTPDREFREDGQVGTILSPAKTSSEIYADKQKYEMLAEIDAPEEKQKVAKAIDRTNEFFSNIGGSTPYQKMQEFNSQLDVLNKKFDPSSFANMTEQELNKVEQDYKTQATQIATNIGLDVDQNGNIRPPQAESDLYKRKLSENVLSIEGENKKEKGFFSNLASSLASGYETASGAALDVLGTVSGLNYFDSYRDLAKGDKYNAAVFKQQATKYDQTIQEYAAQGDLGKATGLAVTSAIESLPYMIPALVNPEYGVYVMGAMSGIDKYRELDEKKIPEWEKVYNSISTGIFEAIFEKVGTGAILSRSKRAMLEMGEKQGKAAITNAVTKSVESNMSKLGKMPEWVKEGLSEVATGIGQDITDKVTVNPDVVIGANAFDNFTVGSLMGKVFALPQDIAKFSERKQARDFATKVLDKLPSDMDIETKINLGWKIVERDKLQEAEDKLDPKFKGKYATQLVTLNTEIDKIANKYLGKAKVEEVPELSVGKIDEAGTEQTKIDYLKEQGVEVPDGTTMEQLDVLYIEAKAKAEPTKPQPEAVVEETPIETKPLGKNENIASAQESIEEGDNSNSNIAYHGTPYNYDSFDPNKIGTGEGASMRGSGMYFMRSKRFAPFFANINNADAPTHIGKGSERADKLKIDPRVLKVTGFDNLNLKKGSSIQIKSWIKDQQKDVDAGYDGYETERGEITVFPESIQKLKVEEKTTIEDFITKNKGVDWREWTTDQNRLATVAAAEQKTVAKAEQTKPKQEPVVVEAAKLERSDEDIAKTYGAKIKNVSTDIIDRIPRGATNEDITAAKEKIQKDGFVEPIVVTYNVKDNTTVLSDGHHRLAAAKELGIKNIPVKVNVSWMGELKSSDIKINKENATAPQAIDVEKYKKENYAPSVVSPDEIGLTKPTEIKPTETTQRPSEPLSPAEAPIVPPKQKEAKKQQKEVVVEATDFKTELSQLKKEKPNDYWSVDMPSDEVIDKAEKDGRIIETEGGRAIVKEDGDIVGVYSNQTTKGVFGRLIQGIVKLGGNKLDAYDTKKSGKGDLVANYEKNGFRVVARVDFNESEAPKDMPKDVRSSKPDVVVMVYDPSGKMKIKERRFGKDQYTQALSYRDSFLSEETVPDHNKSAETQNFFSDVVTGKSEKYKPKKKWSPILVFSKAQEAVRKVYEKFNGNFDEHIATSIPAFRDVQIKVVFAINKMIGSTGGLVYDIGGSEGGFAKTITSLSRGKVKSINLDANRDMQKVHNANPVSGSTFVKEAFGEGFDYNGVTYKRHTPKKKADIVHESMTFQFIDHKRADKLDEVVDNYLKPDGLFITEEKVHAADKEQFDANEAKKDNDFKSQYYDKDQIDKKKEEVLTGMAKDQTTYERYKNELLKRFDFVEEYWDGGNFKGLVASNDKAKIDLFLKEVGNTDTEFSEKNIKKQPVVSGEQIEVKQLKKEEDGKETSEKGNEKGRQERLLSKSQEADALLADGLSDLADLLGAKLSLTGEQRVKAKDAIKKIAKGLLLKGEVSAEQLFNAIKDYLSKAKYNIDDDIISEALKEEGYATKVRESNKGDLIQEKGLVEGAQGQIPVRNIVEDQEAPRGEGEELRAMGVKIIESTSLPEPIKDKFKKDGISYVPRGAEITGAEARQIAGAKLEMDGGRQRLKEDILNDTNGIKGDTRVHLAAIYIEKVRVLADAAKTPQERSALLNDVAEVLRFMMERSTGTAQELQSYKIITELLMADPDMLEMVYRKHLDAKNEKFYSSQAENIKSAQKIIEDFVLSKEFKDKYKPKTEPKQKTDGLTTTQRKERGIAKIAEAMDFFANRTKAKLNLVEDIDKTSNEYKAILKIADGLLDIGIASTQDLITKLKVKLRPYFTSRQIDGITEDLIKDTDAPTRLVKKKAAVAKISAKDEKMLVDRLYEKLTVGTEAQLRTLISDNIELLEREGSINDDSFKELFAKALGREHVTPQMLEELRNSGQAINDIKNIESALELLFNRLIEATENNQEKEAIKLIEKEISVKLKEHRDAVFRAAKANQFISEVFANPTSIARMLATNIQGNLLTPASQVVNLVSNVSWMPTRTFKNIVAIAIDRAISGVGGVKTVLQTKIINKINEYKESESLKTGVPKEDIIAPKYLVKALRILATMPDEQITRKSIGLSGTYFKGFGRGAVEGARQLWTGQLSDDVYAREIAKAMHPFQAWYDNYQMLTGAEKKKTDKIIKNFIEGTVGVAPEIMFRFLNLGDKPFRRGAELDRLNEIANIKGLTGAAKQKFIEMPDEESKKQALEAGLEAVYAQDNFLSDASKWLDRKLNEQQIDKLGTIEKVTRGILIALKASQMPYVKTPTNILIETIDYAIPWVAFAKALVYAGRGNRRMFTDSMARGMVGLFYNAAVSSLFATGILTLAPGGDEEDKAKKVDKKIIQAEYRDRPAYSINEDALQRLMSNIINGTNESLKWKEGDEINSYKRFGIHSAILMAHAESYRGMSPEEIKKLEGIDRMFVTSFSVISSGLDQSFVSGISTLLNTFTGSEYEREAWLLNTTKALSATAVPNSFRAIQQARDNYMRETRDQTKTGLWNKYISTAKNDFKSSYTTKSGLPIKRTIWGEEVKRFEDGSSPFFQLFDITKTIKYKGDFGTKLFELYKEIRADETLTEKTKDLVFLPSVLDASVVYKGNKIKLDPWTYDSYVQYVGSGLKKKVEAKVSSLDWEKKSPEKKAIILDGIFSGQKSARGLLMSRWERLNKTKLNDLWLKQEAERKAKNQ